MQHWERKQNTEEDKKEYYDICYVAAVVGKKAHLRMK